MYKAVFIDIDGTLRDNKKHISKRTIEAIKKVTEKGILVIMCSGRPRQYTENISKKCFASKYIIASSGANIYDYEENKTMYVNPMDKEEVIKLYEIAESENLIFVMNVGEGRVVNKIEHPYEDKLLDEDIRDFVYKNDIFQCMIEDESYEKVKRVISKIEKLEKVEIRNRSKSLFDPNYQIKGNLYCDISDANTNKGDAVEKLCKMLNINPKDAVAIGDDVNDLSMFEKVGYSVAVANARDDIKQYADEITSSNEKNGVALFLEKMLKEMK